MSADLNLGMFVFSFGPQKDNFGIKLFIIYELNKISREQGLETRYLMMQNMDLQNEN